MSDPVEIRPLPHARRKAFAELGSRAGRERRGRFLLEGPRAIAAALDRGVEFEALVVDDAGEAVLREWGAGDRLPAGLETYRAAARDLAELADTATPQGMLAIGRRPRAALEDLPPPGGRVVLVADGVQDPGNLGTLLRTLAAAGGTTAICLRGTVDPWNPKALRGAAGATFALAIAVTVEPADALGWCATRGIPVVALSADAPSLLERPLPGGAVALVVGNEAAGLSPAFEEGAAVVASLPMAPGVESLSAAVAGSIAMYVLAHGLVPAAGAPA
ncbi:MAG TPA: RNA methyltransferase [Gemmatimonadota bacterium]|nr:RNA methyltransferase [Gemmatimonadota bacterium]